MVLHPHHDAELLSVLAARLQILRHPLGDLVAFGAFVLVSGEDAKNRGAHLGGGFDPVLGPLHVDRAGGFVSLGEVVADAGAADGQAQLVRAALEGGDVGIGRHLRVTGEEVSRRIDRVEIVVGAEVQQVEE